MSQVKSIKLNRTGDQIPLVGFGTARISVDETEDVVYNAIKNGYRLIDGALLYRNEAQVGKAVRKAIADGIVKREDLFIVGKLWNHFHHKDNVRRAFDVTLENYGLDHIDLYLVHFPLATAYEDPKDFGVFFNKNSDKLNLERSPLHETWKELEKLVDEGLVRNIGISNYNTQTILDLLAYARIKPSVLEIEWHPYLQQKRFIDWVRAQDIEVIAYAPFGNAVFEKVPSKTAHLQNLLTHPVVTKIAEKHGKNAGQIALKFAVQQNLIVIPKSIQDSRQKSNLDLFSFELDKQDFEDLEGLEANARFNDFFENTSGFNLPLWE